MNVKLINRDTCGELLLIGRLDANTAEQVAEIADSVSERFENLVLNLSDLEYTSSAGLRMMLNLQRKMTRKGGTLKLKGVNDAVMEVLEMTGFASFLSFED